MSLPTTPVRPTRARKSVATYDLKVLSGIPTRRTSKRSLDDDAAGPSNKAHEHRNSSGGMEDSKAATPHDDGNVSSQLTSPMRSPGLAALQTSLTNDNDATAATDPDQNKAAYDCFNSQLLPKGHFYSANQLYARGVWIGYLAPDRANESFRGLPSLSDLKVNYSKFSPPHPQPVHGTARENRNAVCRGCVSSSSALIALSEIQYVAKSKLVIMPLDGDDEAGVFAIMLPQKTDRSLNGLQSYRFYEVSEGATNTFMMLALRNPDRDAGTLETVLEVLPLQEKLDIAKRFVNQPRADSHRGSARPTSSTTAQQKPQPSAIRASAGVELDAEGLQGAGSRKRRKSIKPIPVPEATRTQEHTHKSNDPPEPSPRVDSAPPKPVEIVSLDLTDDQARRVHFLWPVTVREDDMDYEFVLRLDECGKTLTGLLGLLEEYTEAIPSIANVLARTKLWRFTYQGADGANKAIVARKGTEAAFDRLQTMVAQLPVWNDNPHVRVHVELKSLSRQDSVSAA